MTRTNKSSPSASQSRQAERLKSAERKTDKSSLDNKNLSLGPVVEENAGGESTKTTGKASSKNASTEKAESAAKKSMAKKS